MVSGFDSPVCTRVDRSFVSPAEWYDDVRNWRFADFQETDVGSGWHAMALPKLLEGIAVKETAALRLFQREPWDFFMVVFGESDTVAHHFWMFHDPQSPRHREGFEDAVERVYVRLDKTVGRLVDAAGGDVTVGIVSDHGFGGAGTGVVHLNNWLAKRGYLAFTGGGESLLKRAALTLVPGAWRGMLFRRLRGLASRAESASRFGGIEWAKTTAWSEELNYFPSVRVNLRGREPQGQVDPGEYKEFCQRLCAELRGWEPIADAWHRDELFEGPYVDRAPDIILELALENGYSHSCLRARGGPAFRRIGPEEYLGGKERGMNGNHRPTGILFLSKSTPAGHARLEDVAPTVLAEMGVPAPPMDGASLLGPGAITDTQAPPGAPRDRSYTLDEADAIERRLRDLGYFE
jgi:predicted AlkP superfamily phosphohydrolase/phosphomutase